MNQHQIKQARQEVGLTQEAMTCALGLTSISTYKKWERGEREPTASAIASIMMLLFIHRLGLLREWQVDSIVQMARYSNPSKE